MYAQVTIRFDRADRFEVEQLNATSRSLQWEEPTVKQAEKNFADIFDQIYEEEFIDNIFEEFKSLISYKNFINAIEPKDMLEHLGLPGTIDINPFDEEDANGTALQG